MGALNVDVSLACVHPEPTQRRTWPVSALLRFQDTAICRSLLVLLPLARRYTLPLHHANVYYLCTHLQARRWPSIERSGVPSQRSVPCARCGRQSATTIQPSTCRSLSPRPAKTAAPAGPANLVPPRLWSPLSPPASLAAPNFCRSALAPSALESWASLGDPKFLG